MAEMTSQDKLLEEIKFLRLKNRALESELKSMNEASRKDKLLVHTLDSIRECVSITDMTDKVIYVNKAFLDTYGYEKCEILDKNISIVRSDKNPPGLTSKILPSTIRGGWIGEIYNRKKDGTDFLISLRTSIVRNEAGIPIALVGASLDITEKKLAEEMLRRSEENYRTLFEETKDVVYVTTPEGKFIDLNQAGLELFGFASKDDMNKIDVTNDIYINPSERQKFKVKMESDGYVKDYEIRIRTPKGRDLIIVETASAVRDAGCKISAYRGILRDITFIKEAEAKMKSLVEELQENKLTLENSACELELLNTQLSESELELKALNAAKDKYFSILAHDLRSPFTSLIGLSGIIVNDCDSMSTDEIKSFATNINKSARNVFNLLENLLQWSRIQTGRMEYNPVRLDICEVVEQSMSLIIGNAVKKNIDLVSEVPFGSYAYADSNMIGSVIQNLISNAVKFSNKGGVVKASLRELENEFEIMLSDTGIGMTAKDLSKLFRIDTHHTTVGTGNEKGTGLGLILCKELVEKNGGEIKVESQFGKGSTFRFTLPKYEAAD